MKDLFETLVDHNCRRIDYQLSRDLNADNSEPLLDIEAELTEAMVLLSSADMPAYSMTEACARKDAMQQARSHVITAEERAGRAGLTLTWRPFDPTMESRMAMVEDQASAPSVASLILCIGPAQPHLRAV